MKHKIRNQNYAMKCIRADSSSHFEKSLKSFRSEVAILQALQHPNIIKMYESFENCEKIRKSGEINYFNTIIFELASNGALFDFINSQKFTEDLARTYFHQLVEGLVLIFDYFSMVFLGIQYLHERQILHSDITLENLFISKDFQLKIGDFGCATQISTASSENSFNEYI